MEEMVKRSRRKGPAKWWSRTRRATDVAVLLKDEFINSTGRLHALAVLHSPVNQQKSSRRPRSDAE